ncbi:thymidine phosphorylase [Candidatus Fermentibacteria bacterium]|nr:thymidine phosphorylase [Candidatus Fermentibacteria bacterium]
MLPSELIARKRDGGEIPEADLYEFVSGVGKGEIPDYQTASWLMACYLKGLSRSETVSLTRAMRDSGRILTWPDSCSRIVDKHSTGGVGDKVSLILAPLAASMGLFVPMISGRSLGHTGGTLDKLESIPGMRVDLGLRTFQTLVREVGVAMVGQTEELAPADRKLYSLRDATSTVTSIPLIVASILSKKLAEGTDALVFDVKVGSGAFMRTLSRARELARSLVEVSVEAGKSARAVLSRMEVPLGRAVGNALEVSESLEALKGSGPTEVGELSVVLAGHMSDLCGADPSLEDAIRHAEQKLSDGSALKVFRTMVRRQGGNLEEFERLPSAKVIAELRSDRTGTFSGIDARVVGETVRELGGGRFRIDEEVDPLVGWERLADRGTELGPKHVIGKVHASDEDDAQRALERISSGIRWNGPLYTDVVIEVI